jgi:carbamoyltransferase
MNILGISFGFHESAACLVQDGKLIFACAEERISRVKQDTRFPVMAIEAALKFAGLNPSDIDHVAFAWPKPGEAYAHNLKLLLTGTFHSSVSRWQKLVIGFLKDQHHRGGELDYIRAFGPPKDQIHFINHHLSHALSAWCLSGFDEAAVLVIDGRGAREATTLWRAEGSMNAERRTLEGEGRREKEEGRMQKGHGNSQSPISNLQTSITLLEQYDYPNSLGVFYAGMTEMLGFQPFSDEWKVMGLASYGKPTVDLSKLIQTDHDSYSVNGRSFFGRTDSDCSALEAVVGPRRNGEELDERHHNMARSAQDACERGMLAMLRRITRLTGSRNLCLAGGVALNCKANGELLRSGLIDNIYVQPAAGDDGACIGAAFAVYQQLGMPLPSHPIGHSYLGMEFNNDQIEQVLKVYKLPYRRVENCSQAAAELLAKDHLVGWFQGRMEFGPRALGNRSILADPRFAENRDRVNDAVKFRENWRPFAPSVLAEKAHLYFQDFKPSPYMILSFWADKDRAHEIPAVVHVDGSCRVQSVDLAINPKYHSLLSAFSELTSTPMLMNTSFNLKGDPIVCTPKDAVQTFYTSGLDDLVIGDFIVTKQGASEFQDAGS